MLGTKLPVVAIHSVACAHLDCENCKGKNYSRGVIFKCKCDCHQGKQTKLFKEPLRFDLPPQATCDSRPPMG